MYCYYEQSDVCTIYNVNSYHPAAELSNKKSRNLISTLQVIHVQIHYESEQCLSYNYTKAQYIYWIAAVLIAMGKKLKL